MLEAIRDLGIIKMIDEFQNYGFDSSALDSAEAFHGQRKKAIENGVYAKLQFEPINSDRIGIFEIDNNDKVKFYEEKVHEDSWKYLFLQTASQGTYISPTWKDSQAKLEKTIVKYTKDAKKSDSEWLKKSIKIFCSTDVEIDVLDKDGNLCKKPFIDVVKWAKEDKKINVFSIKVNDNYNAGISDLLNFALTNKPREIYQTKRAKSFNLSGAKCILCNTDGELFPNVLNWVGINIANVDKPIFFPGVSTDNAGKAFPICAPCAEALYVAKFHVLIRSSELRQDIAGHKALIIPHLIKSNNKQEGLEIVKAALKLIRTDLDGAQNVETDIIKDLSENSGIATVTFIIGDVEGQKIENIRKIIPNVLHSRLSEIGMAIEEINEIHEKLPAGHTLKLDQPPIDGNLRIIRNVLGKPKYRPYMSSKGLAKPFKASSVNSLDVLNAIFLKKDYPLNDILAEFSSKLSYDFSKATSDELREISIKNNIINMFYLNLFLDKAGVIEMNPGNNFVSKYLERHDGLNQLNDFLSNEAKGIDTKEKEYAFLIGLLLGKLVSIQHARKVSSNALRWLKGIQISQNDLIEIFFKTQKKLNDYSTPDSAWSEEMAGVAEAISALGGALGTDINKWNIGRKEIAYYLCLGQSLSGYYLPSKNRENGLEKE